MEKTKGTVVSVIIDVGKGEHLGMLLRGQPIAVTMDIRVEILPSGRNRYTISSSYTSLGHITKGLYILL